ncbi:MAG: hypothetical protein ACK2UK_01615 [Candidatus Promineifilaceae bacterium]
MTDRLTVSSAADYSILVQGILERPWIEQYGELELFVRNDGGRPLTTAVGTVKDQAALCGLLNFIYGLGMPLLNVTYLGRP